MSQLKRTQLILQTWEGEVVTTTQLTFDKVTNEYITVHSLAWLIDVKPEQIDVFLKDNGLITRERHGQQWVNCSGLMPLFGWTPD